MATGILVELRKKVSNSFGNDNTLIFVKSHWNNIVGIPSDVINISTLLGNKAPLAQFDSHTGNTSNPHSVTKAQVGLGSVTDNAQVTLSTNQTITGLKTFNEVVKLYSASQNTDFSALRIGDRDNYYGFDIKYLGTGTGTNNLLELWADNTTGTPLKSISVDQTGLTTFSKTPTVNGTNVSLVGHTHSQYLTSHQSLTHLVPKTTTINSKPLNGNINLIASDVGARSSTWVPTWAQVTDKPSFATVATSGSYNDLSNKPSIPSIPSVMSASEGNLGIATTQRTINAANLKSIILNHSPAGSRPASDVSSWAKKSSLAIEDIPTGTTGSTVALGNHTHSQYLTSFTETDPTVPSHVKSITSGNISSWNSKQSAITGAATTITSSDLTKNRALISNGSGKVAVSAVTSTELGYLDGVTSSIQTQINTKTVTTLNSGAVNSVAYSVSGSTLTITIS